MECAVTDKDVEETEREFEEREERVAFVEGDRKEQEASEVEGNLVTVRDVKVDQGSSSKSPDSPGDTLIYMVSDMVNDNFQV